VCVCVYAEILVSQFVRDLGLRSGFDRISIGPAGSRINRDYGREGGREEGRERERERDFWGACARGKD